jgi:transposase
MSVDEGMLTEKLAAVLPYLNERDRRRVLAAEARALGRGGVSVVARAAGVSRQTIHTGLKELDHPPEAGVGRVRRPGGGRKRLTEGDQGLAEALDRLVEPTTRGDPESPLRWTTLSVRHLADALTGQGHPAGPTAVAGALREQGYSLQAPAKTLAGTRHPDRDAQFRYINDTARGYLDQGLPVVSVDTKKKELVGRFHNKGREWRPVGQPVEVNVHDFPDPTLGKAIPYGVYDIGANTGWVSVGTDHDTAAFAVATLRRWWERLGQVAYPAAGRLLVCADAGGSNGHRVRLWKVELARLAAETGLAITVCHFPPGTSKWNRIEHRLFSHISMNWRGRPLVSHEVAVDLIGATTTRTGLAVRAELDRRSYPRGVKVSDAELAAVPIARHDFHGEWNYTIDSSRSA